MRPAHCASLFHPFPLVSVWFDGQQQLATEGSGELVIIYTIGMEHTSQPSMI
jgi:hypothetical protein